MKGEIKSMEEIQKNNEKLLKIVEIMSFVLLLISTAVFMMAVNVIDISKAYSIALFMVAFLLLTLGIILNEIYFKYHIRERDLYKSLQKYNKEAITHAYSNWDMHTSIR